MFINTILLVPIAVAKIGEVSAKPFFRMDFKQVVS